MAWANQDLIVFHGTTDAHAAAVAASPDPSFGSTRTDFGLGFYVTTQRGQAQSWANLKAGKSSPAARAAIVEFSVSRDWLASLDGISFVIDHSTTGYWDFVSHCRAGASSRNASGAICADHARVGSKAYYDLVYGPVSLWQQKYIMQNCDQLSFHGPSGIRLHLTHRNTYFGNPTFP